MKSTEALDRLDRRILEVLQKDARVTMAAIGREIGLSSSAVTERVRRLEEAGVIENYRAIINPGSVGLSVQGFMRISGDGEVCVRMGDIVAHMPEVLECHRVTGDDSAILKIATRDMPALEKLIDKLAVYGKPSTSLILSSPIAGRAPSLAHLGEE